MTENKNPGNDPSAEFERLRKRKVLLFAAILGCIFLVAMWLIFRPAPVKPQEGAAGINTSVPDGKAQATVSDKRKAAEQLRSEEQQQRRMMTLGDNSFSLLDDGLKPAEEPAPADNPALRASEANRVMQRQVQGFYAAPQRNAEVEALKEQVAALQSQLDAERQQPDPLELAEEQYKLARKYLGGGVAVDEEAVEQAKQRKDSRLSVMRPVRERSKHRRSTHGRISPSNATWDFSRRQVASRMPILRPSEPASPRRRSYVPEAPCNCGCWKPCVSTE